MADVTVEDVFESLLKLSTAEQARLIAQGMEVLRQKLEAQEAETEEEMVSLAGDLYEIAANLGKHPMTGREIIAAGLTGGWEDVGITDSVKWLKAQRAKFEDKGPWPED
jgi:hypothetical protein